MASSSAPYLKTTTIPNPIHPFVPEEFIEPKTLNPEVAAVPEENGDLHLFDETTRWHIANSGSTQVSPFSMNWNQHREIYSALSVFKKYAANVALSSCRVDEIARDPGLVQIIQHFGSSKLVTAIEGISERLCNFMQKSLTTDELLNGMNHIFEQGFRQLKLYYIFTGLETEEDIAEFLKFVQSVDDLRNKHEAFTLSIRFSFTSLLSTIGTPLQYHGSQVSKSLRRRNPIIYQIRRIVTRFGFTFRLSSPIASTDYNQLIEFADRRAAPLIEHIGLNGVNTEDRLRILFTRFVEEIDKPTYDALSYFEKSTMRVGEELKRYQTDVVDKLNFSRLYELINEYHDHPDHPVISSEELQAKVEALHGQPTPEWLLEVLFVNRREKLRDTHILITRSNPTDLLHTYPNGRRVMAMIEDFRLGQSGVDRVKNWLPQVTNGFSFEDVTQHKLPTQIFPSTHIQFHRNQIAQMSHWKQYTGNRAFLFSSYCFSAGLSSCVSCGTCETKEEVQEVSSRKKISERGHSHMHLIKDVDRAMVVNQKILVEVEIEPGKFGAVKPEWLTVVVLRALMRTFRADPLFMTGVLPEKTVNSRKFYEVKQDEFKSPLSGTFLLEVPFNRHFSWGVADIEHARREINKHTTPGWKIRSLHRKASDFVLRNHIDLALVKYTFNYNKVKGLTFKFLQGCLKRFKDPRAKVTYKQQVVTGRFSTAVEARDFDKANVIKMELRPARDREALELWVLAKVSGVQPLIFLAGLMGSKGDAEKARGYSSIVGTEVSIHGFYRLPKQLSATQSIFDEGICPVCKGPKFYNSLTGELFGVEPHEQTEDNVCQNCFMEVGR